MIELWDDGLKDENSKQIITLETVKKLGYKRKRIGRKTQPAEVKKTLSDDDNDELIKEGIEEIIQQYVDSIIKKIEEKEIEKGEQNIKSKSLNTVSRILYYLSTPSGSKHTLNAEDIVKLATEESDVFKQLDLPEMWDKNDVARILEQLDRDTRILRTVGGSPKQDEINKRYEIYFDGLIPALQSWRTKYISQLRKISLKQNLPQESLALCRGEKRELAALLACKAYSFHREIDYPKDLCRVDAALREVLQYPYFSCLINIFKQKDLDFSIPKQKDLDFWQVKFNGDGTILAAIAILFEI